MDVDDLLNTYVGVELDQMDGIEVYNGHPDHESHNDLALERASHGGSAFILTSGSDAHRLHHLARGGMLTDEEIRTEAELVDWLKRNPKGQRVETYP